jgi:hypothetical protein
MFPMGMNFGTSTQNTSNRADPYAYDLYKNILGRANDLTQQGYQQYGGQRVADLTPDQLAAFQGVRDIQGKAGGLYDQATGSVQNVLSQLDPSKFGSNIQNYFNPYQKNVVDATMKNIQENNALQQNQLTSNAIKSGAMGGDRSAIARAELARTQALTNNQTLANLQQQGYQNAADQYNKAQQMGLTGATTLGGLASTGQKTGLEGLQSLLGIGGQQQLQNQQNLDVNYQNFLQQQAYPYQQLSWLSGLAGGLGPAMGGSSSSSGTNLTQNYQPQPSTGSQIMGGLTTLGGMFAPAIGNALLPGIGGAIGAGLGAMGAWSPFPSKYASGGTVDYDADQQLMERSAINPDETLYPYMADAGEPYNVSDFDEGGAVLKASGGPVVRPGLNDGLILEKIMGGMPYGGATSYLSPELIAMNKPREFRAPSHPRLDYAESPKSSEAPRGAIGNYVQGITSTLKAVQDYNKKSAEGREHAATGGSFQSGYAPTFPAAGGGGYGKGMGFNPGYGGYGKGQGFNPQGGGMGKGLGFSPYGPGIFPNQAGQGGNYNDILAAQRAQQNPQTLPQTSQSGAQQAQQATPAADPMVPNPNGGPDIPASQLAFMQGKSPTETPASPQLPMQLTQGGGYGKGQGFNPRGGGYGKGQGFNPRGGFGMGFNPAIMQQLQQGQAGSAPATQSQANSDPRSVMYAHGGLVRQGYRDGFRVEDYLPALAMGETGGEDDPYSVVGPANKKGNRPYGKYQIMDFNIPSWAKEAGYEGMTPEQFLADKKAQEKIASVKFGEYLDKSGSPEKASAMWFGGPEYMKHPNAKDVLGTSIPKYQETFMRNLGGLKASPMGLNAGKDIVAMDRDEDNVVATDEAPAKQEGGFQITPEMQMGIISAGLGMLANRSPFMGVGVGEGGLKGVETYMNALSGRRQQQQLEQQRENIQSEIQQRGVETALKQRQMQMLLEADKANRALFSSPTVATDQTAAPIVGQDAEGTGEIGAPTDLTGSGYSTTGEPSTPKPIVVAADESSKADIDPLWDPRRLALGVQINSIANPNLAKLYQERLSQIEQTGMVYDRQGKPIPLPGYLEKKAAEKATETTAQKAAEANYTYVDVQPEPGGPIYKVKQSELENFTKKHPEAQPVNPGAGTPPGGEQRLPKGAVASKQPEFYKELQTDIAKDERKMLEQYQGRQVIRERLDTMADILANYQPGKWAEQKASLISGLRSIGFPVSEENIRSAADFETFTKNATINLFDQVKNLGGRILVTEIEGMKQANPSASLQPETNKRVIGQMRGLLDYEDKHFNDYSDWKKGNRNAYDTSDFERGWIKDNKPKKFIEESTKSIGAKGVAVPPKDQLKVGDTYIINNVKRRWNGTGFEKVQ